MLHGIIESEHYHTIIVITIWGHVHYINNPQQQVSLSLQRYQLEGLTEHYRKYSSAKGMCITTRYMIVVMFDTQYLES